jgi:hypothetical protein
MRSIVDRNVVMRRKTVHCNTPRNAQDMFLEWGGGALTETVLKGVISTLRKWGKEKIQMNGIMNVY